MKNKKIFAIGAFDRFNYGDLLFPIISKNFIQSHYPNVDFECYASIKSDFSNFGGLPTKPLSTLYAKNGVNDGDIIYFCGGGTLGSNWQSMYANLLGKTGNACLYYMSRLMGSKLSNNLSRLRFGGNSAFPWIASPTDFSARVKVIYNAVGGSELAFLPEEDKHLALKKIATASYFSVRDSETQKICQAIDSGLVVHLAPDSAVLMSEQYPKSLLESKISEKLCSLLTQDKYVCFHSNYGYAKKNFNAIAKELERLYIEKGLKAILLPIGRYVGLDDYQGLMELKKHIKTPVEILNENITIWEIMYTIASASLFIGTSLHGNVTAQSFAVPHIGLSDRKSKLNFYLNTWDIPQQSTCPAISDLYNAANEALKVPDAVHIANKTKLINLATLNLHNIMNVVLS